MKLTAILLLAAIGALWPRSATAGEGDASVADALFRAGRAALADGDLALACTRFAESYRLDPAAGTVLNLADCEEKSGRLSLALTHFAEARDALAPRDFRLPTVKNRIASLDKRVPRLTLVSAAPLPKGAHLECDGVELGPGALGVALPVDPGPHTCTLHVVDRSDSRVEIVLKEGEHRSVAIQPGAPTTGNVAFAPAPVPPPHRESPEVSAAPPSRAAPPNRAAPSNRTPVYALGAVGIAGMIVGATSGVLALRAGDAYRAHCTPDCDPTGVDAASRGRTMVIVSPVGFAIGIAGLGAAAIVFALGNRVKPASVQIGPAGVFVASSF